MIKLSNATLANSVQTLNNLSQQQLPVIISYAISKNIAKVEGELKIYNTEKQKLIDKYSVKDENEKTKIEEDGTIRIADENVEEWNKDIAELGAIEVEIDIHLIQISKLENSNFSIAPSELMKIDYMITE